MASIVLFIGALFENRAADHLFSMEVEYYDQSDDQKKIKYSRALVEDRRLLYMQAACSNFVTKCADHMLEKRYGIGTASMAEGCFWP